MVFKLVRNNGTVPIYLPDVIMGTGVKQYLVKVTGWKGLRNKEINLTLEEV